MVPKLKKLQKMHQNKKVANANAVVARVKSAVEDVVMKKCTAENAKLERRRVVNAS